MTSSGSWPLPRPSNQVVVAGTPHEKWGSAVTAFFVPAGGTCDEATIVRLDEWVRTSWGCRR